MDMPKRIVCIKTVDSNAVREIPIRAGTVMELTERECYGLIETYPGHFSIIEMTEKDWLDLTVTNFNETDNRLDKLITINERMGLGITYSDSIKYYSGSVSPDGKLKRPHGLSEDFWISKYYKDMVEVFERKIVEQLSNEKNKAL